MAMPDMPQLYEGTARCVCGHAASSHFFRGTHVYADCRFKACHCKLFTAQPADSAPETS